MFGRKALIAVAAVEVGAALIPGLSRVALAQDAGVAVANYRGTPACGKFAESARRMACEMDESVKRTKEYQRQSEEAKRQSEEAKRQSADARREIAEAKVQGAAADARGIAAEQRSAVAEVSTVCLQGVQKDIEAVKATRPLTADEKKDFRARIEACDKS